MRYVRIQTVRNTIAALSGIQVSATVRTSIVIRHVDNLPLLSAGFPLDFRWKSTGFPARFCSVPACSAGRGTVMFPSFFYRFLVFQYLIFFNLLHWNIRLRLHRCRYFRYRIIRLPNPGGSHKWYTPLKSDRAHLVSSYVLYSQLFLAP